MHILLNRKAEMASGIICDMIANLVPSEEDMLGLNGNVAKMLRVEDVDQFAEFHKNFEGNCRTTPAGVLAAKDELLELLCIKRVVKHADHGENCHGRYRYQVVEACRKLSGAVEIDKCYNRLVEETCSKLGCDMPDGQLHAAEAVVVSCISSYLVFGVQLEWNQIVTRTATGAPCEPTCKCCGLDAADAAMVTLLDFMEHAMCGNVTEHAMCENGLLPFREVYNAALRIALAKLQSDRIEIKQKFESERRAKAEIVRQQYCGSPK